MGKAIKALLAVLAIWVGVEVMTEGPSRAFGGVFADFISDKPLLESDSSSTAQRAGAGVARARDAASERRERMLAE